ncbi:MAG: shikimate kinase [Aquiluna sp.]|jgi:shikimate kinase|nr:shikimate kinase [Aquiluna sp.]
MGSIVLVGPMGAGKTTLGKRLAKVLDLPFVDTDKMVAADHGSIKNLFAMKGEAHFRDLESAALVTALNNQGVVATGGGIVLSQENRTLLSQNATIFLDTNMEFVLRSLNVSKRPLLKDNPEMWEQIYRDRLEFYREVSVATVNTANTSVGAIMKNLESEVRKYV